jgi:hypothetical protein
MDLAKISIYVGSAVTALLVGLLLVGPVSAQAPGPNDELHINSAGVASGELPYPLPDPGAGASLPDMTLPNVSHSNWPSSVPSQNDVRDDVEGYVEGVNGVLNDQYSWVLERIYQARTVTNQARSVIGDVDQVGAEEIGFSAASDEGEISAASIATDLAGAIRWSMAYLRALSNLGPLGLDLAFVFIGLGWIVLVNVMDMAVRLVAWLLGLIFKVVSFVLGTLIDLVIGIINIILKILEIILPF